MIDIHSHVLPELDDGAANLDEALQLVAQYSEQKVTTVVCTPHVGPETLATPAALAAFLDIRDRRIHRLQSSASACGHGVTFLTGVELMLNTAILRCIKLPQLSARLTINAGSYLLVELPGTLAGGLQTLEGLLFEIQLAGLQPILAHPERTAHNEGVMPVLKDWMNRGRILMQANAGHLVDDPGLDPERRLRYQRRRGLVHQMIREGMIHFIASDAHSPGLRPCQLQAAYAALSRQFGRDMADRLCIDNPARVVQGKDIHY